MYADDVIFLKSLYLFDALATCSALNTDLKSIAEWFTNNAMHLNLSKSSLLIVDSSTLLSCIQFFDVSLNSIPIPPSPLRFLVSMLTFHVIRVMWPSSVRLLMLVYVSLSPSSHSFLLLKTPHFSIICYFSISLR